MHLETPMGTSNRIEMNPEIMLGKPVIRGTRVTVELLLRKLSQGTTEESLLEAYPHLTREDIKAAIAYAADTIAQHKSWEDKGAARAPQKPQTALFKGPGGSTGQLIGESDEQPPGDPPWRSS
jgi:uncharacterized protein (DUF433 family)